MMNVLSIIDPLARDGHFELTTDDGLEFQKNIRIDRLQLEQVWLCERESPSGELFFSEGISSIFVNYQRFL